MIKFIATINESQLDNVRHAISDLEWTDCVLVDSKNFESYSPFATQSFIQDCQNTVMLEIMIERHQIENFVLAISHCLSTREKENFHYQINDVEKWKSISSNNSKFVAA